MEAGNEGKIQKESKHELFKTFDRLKSEILHLKNQLNHLNREKEAWFSRKEKLSMEIKGKIASFRENKAKRDELTKKVKDLKEKRESLWKETNEKISVFKKASEEKNSLISKTDIKDPFRLKKIIDDMETKLETEVMPFQKEKEISKKIKKLKNSLEDASGIMKIIFEMKKLGSAINLSKKTIQDMHGQIQKNASDSQKLHEEMIKSSKEIDQLKIKENEAFSSFSKLKHGFNEANKSLKEKLNLVNNSKSKIDSINLEEQQRKSLNQSIIIQGKEQEIEEKFKTGKKLTTEDFMVFQDLIKHKKNKQS